MQGLYNDTVTVFNRVKGGKGKSDTWIPTVLENVELQAAKTTEPTTRGLESADKVTLFVKYKLQGMKIGTLSYIKPKEWAALSSKDSTVTFDEGTSFFARGEYAEAITDDDYEEGFFNHMAKTYDDVWKITKVAAFKLIPHFEVGGA